MCPVDNALCSPPSGQPTPPDSYTTSATTQLSADNNNGHEYSAGTSSSEYEAIANATTVLIGLKLFLQNLVLFSGKNYVYGVIIRVLPIFQLIPFLMLEQSTLILITILFESELLIN
jgi:hypothetical protein